MSSPGRPADELLRVTRSVRSLLTLEREGGLTALHGLPSRPPPQSEPAARHPATTNRSGAARTGAAPARRRAPGAQGQPARPRHRTRVPPLELPPDALAPFGELPARVAGCTACPLGRSRTCTVFGEGSATADLVFCGEAPGFDEDRSGRPFVGRAGELLSAMIEKGLRMRREDVFILNTLKCRPPGNRDPAPEESAACRPHLEEQMRVLAPRVIVTLGNAAARAILGTSLGITRLRRQVHASGQVPEAFGAQVVPTLHPAYLLRNPAAKRDAWEDLKKVLALLR